MDEGNHPSIDLGIEGIDDPTEVGVGGFAVVYAAHEHDLGRQVAVKVLTCDLDTTGRNRFERERKAMGRLSGHPNIVTVHRGGYTNADQAYLVMEYLPKGSLSNLLRSTGPLSWADAVHYTIQTAGALETAHRAGVIHRDLKPANILLSEMGNAKLGDFGIARLSDAPETRSHGITASISHVAPEIVAGHRPTPSSDIYSLTSTLYELLSGKPPFVNSDDESIVPILARVTGESPARLPSSVAPPELWAVIEKGLAKDPDARHRSPVELAESLCAVQSANGIQPTIIPIHTDQSSATPPPLVDQPTAPLLPPEPKAPSSPPPPTPSPSPPTPPAPPVDGSPELTRWVKPEPSSKPGRARWIKVLIAVASVVVIYFVVSALPNDDDDDDYAEYVELVDPTGSISATVPRQWDNQSTSNASAGSNPNDPKATLSATQSASADWLDSYDEPGVILAAYMIPELEFSGFLERVATGDCTDGISMPLSPPHQGQYVVRHDCGEANTYVVDAIFDDPNSDIVVFLQLRAVKDRDIDAFTTIVQSLVIDNNF